ncbi:MAG: hypothetical protein AAGH43_06230 [Pseudomonadota bacterium]
MNWSWSDVYPRHRVLTVILAPGDAETFLAMPGVRIIGDHVALVEAFNAPLTTAPMLVETALKPKKGPTPGPKPKPAPRRSKPLPVSPAPITKPWEITPTSPRTTRTISDDLPPRHHEPERPPSNVSAGDIALVEDAIASGKVTVTKCPPCKHTPEDDVGYLTGWKAARQRGGKRAQSIRSRQAVSLGHRKGAKKRSRDGPMGAKGE